MAKTRIQFSLTWVAIVFLVLAAFFGGVSVGRRCYEIENKHALDEILRVRSELARRQDELIEYMRVAREPSPPEN